MNIIHSVQIRFEPLLLPAIIIIAAACAWIVLYYIRFLRTVDFPRLWRPLILRTLVFISLIFLAAGPHIYYEGKASAPLNVAVLLDASQSMTIADGHPTRPRFVRATDAAEKILSSAKDINFRLFTFGDSIREITPGDISQLARGGNLQKTNVFPAAASSRIIDAIADIDRKKEENFNSIVLLTDGGETAARISGKQLRALLSSGIKNASDKYHSPKEWFLPIFIAGFGEKFQQPNLSLEQFFTDDFVEAGKSQLAAGTLFSSGIRKKQTVGLELSIDGAMKSSRTITLSNEEPATRFSFSFMPEGVGLHSVRVRTRMRLEEPVVEDNHRTVYVRVVSEKEKILYADVPRWEFKFLKRQLEGQEKIESDFLLLSPRGDLMKKSSTDVLASPAKLGKYRVVILGGLASYTRAVQENALVDFVNRGGSLVVLGGSGSLLTLRFRTLSAMLPAQPLSNDVSRGKFAVKPDPAGVRHPIMQISRETSRDSVWNTLPYLYTYNALQTKGNSQVLAVQPWDWCAGHACPLMVLGKYGKGSVLIIAVEGLWRWKLNPNSSQYYERLWKNILTYLMQVEPEADWSFSVSSRNFLLGDKVCFSARPNREIQTKTAAAAVENMDKKTKMNITLTKNRSGEAYSGCFRATETGDYRATLRVNNKASSDNEPFSVEVAAAEFRHPELADRLLREIAADTGGRYFDESQIKSLVSAIQKQKNYTLVNKEYNPASSPIFYIFLIVLLSIEWAIRRREGFV